MMIRNKKKIKHEVMAKKTKEMGYTVTHLARVVGVSRQEMSRILNGRSQPSAVVLVRLCEALKIQPKEVIE
jgi:transcriptional regulator with XRE-family HTH domain